MKSIFLTLFIVCFIQFNSAQKQVSITIDDVPNTITYKKENYKSVLLYKLDSLNIPVAIFINEGLIYKGDSISKNFKLLNTWVLKDYISLGNHSFNHARYSEVGLDSFSLEIKKGEVITRELAKKYNKKLIHFRFPYNDLGKDSIQQTEIAQLLTKLNYKVTPFTIESSDWMYNYLYEHYLDKNEPEKALEIGNKYVNKTLAFFEFFEAESQKEYNRSIRQIYLCHDNKLNADFLPKIVNKLKQQKYQFISLDDAIEDEVYLSKNKYYKKWGISWFYRWVNDKSRRKELFKKEPSTQEIYALYNKILKENSTKN